MDWLRKMLGISTREEIRADVESEPSIKEARAQLKRVDAILQELEEAEKPRPRRRTRARAASGRS